jgi:hypothetical protein
MRSVATLILSAALLCMSSFQTPNDCPNVPAINKKITAYVKTQIGKKCGDYCNTLFEKAHKAAGLNWWGSPTGTRIDYSKECVYPGDMLELADVELTWKKNGGTTGLKYDMNVLYFIYKVKGKGSYTVVRTATVDGKMKVIEQDLEINNYKGRKPEIKRPGTPNTID